MSCQDKQHRCHPVFNCLSLRTLLLDFCGLCPFAAASYDASDNATQCSSCGRCGLLPCCTNGSHLPQLLLPLLQQLLLLLLCCLPGLSPLLFFFQLVLCTKGVLSRSEIACPIKAR